MATGHYARVDSVIESWPNQSISRCRVAFPKNVSGSNCGREGKMNANWCWRESSSHLADQLGRLTFLYRSVPWRGNLATTTLVAIINTLQIQWILCSDCLILELKLRVLWERKELHWGKLSRHFSLDCTLFNLRTEIVRLALFVLVDVPRCVQSALRPNDARPARERQAGREREGCDHICLVLLPLEGKHSLPPLYVSLSFRRSLSHQSVEMKENMKKTGGKKVLTLPTRVITPPHFSNFIFFTFKSRLPEVRQHKCTTRLIHFSRCDT